MYIILKDKDMKKDINLTAAYMELKYSGDVNTEEVVKNLEKYLNNIRK